MSAMSWRKSEGGIVGRYGDPRKSLRSVALTIADNEVNPAVQSFLVDEGSSLSQLKLRLLPRVDEVQLERLSPEALSGLGVSLILRDPAMKVYTLLESWRLAELPESVALDGKPQYDLQVLDRIVLSIGLTALEDGGAVRRGTTFARKDFVIQSGTTGSQFPHSPVPPSYFDSFGLPRTTAWYVHIKDETGEGSASDTFEVLINNELLSKIGSSSGSDAIWAALAADTFAVLMQTLLRNPFSETPSQGSILAQISKQITLQGHTVQGVAEWLRNGEYGKVLSLSQAMTRATKIIGDAI